MRHLIVREHERVPVRDTRQHADERVLLPREAEALLALCEREKLPAVVGAHRSVKFRQYCGVLQAGDLMVEVLPKIAGQDDFDRSMLLRMVALAANLPLARLEASRLARQQHTMLTVLVEWFCDEVSAQAHQGLLKQYVTEADALPSIRGRWRPEVDALRHPGRPDRLHCHFDELTADNLLNQLLKAALRRVEPSMRVHAVLQRRVQELCGTLGDVRDVWLTHEDVDRLSLNRLTQRYSRALMMARWFLAQEAPDLRQGGRHGLALMFDMNALFQRTLAAAMSKALPEGWQLREEGPRRYLAVDHLGDQRFQLRPDICLLQDGQVRAIVDAKWKVLEGGQDGRWSVGQGDVYQLNAYASTYGCDRLALCYPAHSLESASVELPHYELKGSDRAPTLHRAIVKLARWDLSAGLEQGGWTRGIVAAAAEVLQSVGVEVAAPA